MLPCLILMSCGEIGADASVASSLPAIFGLANVDIDHAKAITATAAIAAVRFIEHDDVVDTFPADRAD
jgi:hypothetical protein